MQFHQEASANPHETLIFSVKKRAQSLQQLSLEVTKAQIPLMVSKVTFISLFDTSAEGLSQALYLYNHPISSWRSSSFPLPSTVRTGTNNPLKCSKCMEKISSLSKSASHFHKSPTSSCCHLNAVRMFTDKKVFHRNSP